MSLSRNELTLGASTARALLDAGCIRFRKDEPFRLPSGWASPVYIDCRRLISFPKLQRALVQRGLELLRDRECVSGVDVVAGAESGGIAYAAWVADLLDVPMVYVRKEAKGLGPAAQVEGVLRAGDGVLLVDDMMAAGRSKATFCAALESAGAETRDIFVLFDYGTFPTENTLAPWHVRVHSLANWHDILDAARASSGHDYGPGLHELASFLADPAGWSEAHGGIGAT